MAKAKAPTVDLTKPPVLAVVPFKDLKALNVNWNFDELKTFLTAFRDKYKGVVMTQTDMDKVKALKKETTGYRTSLKSIKDTVTKERFNGPKKTFHDEVDELTTLVEEVESEIIDPVLDAADKERRDEVTEALDAYKKNLTEETGLRPEYVAQVEYREKYYNVTQKEKDTLEDLRAQFSTLKAEQLAFDADTKLIKKACEGYPEINVEEQLKKLERMTGAQVVEWLDTEKERIDLVRSGGAEEAINRGVVDKEDEEDSTDLAEEADAEHTPGTPAYKKAVAATAKKVDLTTDLPGKFKTLDGTLSYPYDGSEAMTELFKLLKPFGITFKQKKE